MVVQAIADGVLVEDEIIDRTPAGRLAEPADIARAIVMLCGPDAGFVTAQTLVVDGGYSMFGAAHPATRLPGHGDDDA
jgi:3-oxoacyl-[acyl-carrier protein] reductase